MNLFLINLYKILPCYWVILSGFVLGRFANISRETISTLALYLFAPGIMIIGASELTSGIELLLPFIFAGVGIILSCGWYFFSRKHFDDESTRLLAFTTGTANAGYFGIPLTLALLGPAAVPIAVMCAIGTSLFESTVGYYHLNRIYFSMKKAIKRLFHLPIIYSFFLGGALSFFHWQLPQTIFETLNLFKAAYPPIGLLMIGLGLAAMTKSDVDLKFCLAAFINKFICWPILILALVEIDHYCLHLFSPLVHKVLLVESVVPMAANTIVYASIFNLRPGKAAFTVFISTIMALIYSPAMGAFISVYFGG